MNKEAIANELNWDLYAGNYSAWIAKQLTSFRRDAWLSELCRALGEEKNKKVLDVGTGPGFFPIILSEAGYQITGIDSSEQMITVAANNLSSYGIHAKLLQMNAEDLQFSDGSFDAVIARNITYALSEPEKAYSEWLRVLKKGGKLLIYDHNWFYFLCNEADKLVVMDFLEKFHLKTGKAHETYEIEVEQFYEHIISRPMTHRKRPEWDVDFFSLQGIKNVSVDFNSTKKMFTEYELYENSPTPMFVLEIIK